MPPTALREPVPSIKATGTEAVLPKFSLVNNGPLAKAENSSIQVTSTEAVPPRCYPVNDELFTRSGENGHSSIQLTNSAYPAERERISPVRLAIWLQGSTYRTVAHSYRGNRLRYETECNMLSWVGGREPPFTRANLSRDSQPLQIGCGSFIQLLRSFPRARSRNQKDSTFKSHLSAHTEILNI